MFYLHVLLINKNEIISCGTGCNHDICAQETGEVISCFKTIWVGKLNLPTPFFPSFILPYTWGFLLSFKQFCHFLSCASVPGKFLVLDRVVCY